MVEMHRPLIILLVTASLGIHAQSGPDIRSDGDDLVISHAASFGDGSSNLRYSAYVEVHGLILNEARENETSSPLERLGHSGGSLVQQSEDRLPAPQRTALYLESLKVLVGRLDVELSDARAVRSLFKDVRSQLSYSLAIMLLMDLERSLCVEQERRDKDLAPMFRSLPDACKLKSVDVGGLASWKDSSEGYKYTPEAVYVINMTMDRKIQQLTELHDALENIRVNLEQLLGPQPSPASKSFNHLPDKL